MPQTRPLLTDAEKKALATHLAKHKILPFQYRFRKTVAVAAFSTADGALGDYFTLEFTPDLYTGIVSIAAGFILTPNTTVGQFAIQASYKSTMTMADGTALTSPDSNGDVIYNLISNGGAINDFQVFFPLNWYIEAKKTMYFHVWADRTTITAATAVMSGHVTLGTMQTDQG